MHVILQFLTLYTERQKTCATFLSYFYPWKTNYMYGNNFKFVLPMSRDDLYSVNIFYCIISSAMGLGHKFYQRWLRPSP